MSEWYFESQDDTLSVAPRPIHPDRGTPYDKQHTALPTFTHPKSGWLALHMSIGTERTRGTTQSRYESHCRLLRAPYHIGHTQGIRNSGNDSSKTPSKHRQSPLITFHARSRHIISSLAQERPPPFPHRLPTMTSFDFTRYVVSGRLIVMTIKATEGVQAIQSCIKLTQCWSGAAQFHHA